MESKIAIIGLLVAIIAGLAAYLLWPNTTHAPSSEESPQSEKVDVSVPEQAPTTSAGTKPKPTTQPKITTATQAVTKGGTYESYTTGAVGYAALGEVVLFFHSPSCPACLLLDKDIVTNLARIPNDVKILKVDFDTATDLKTKYGVTEPHRFIQVNSAGDRITQWGLSSTLSDLVTRIVRY